MSGPAEAVEPVVLAEPAVAMPALVPGPVEVLVLAAAVAVAGPEGVEPLLRRSSGRLFGWPELPAYTAGRSMTREKLLGLPC